MEVFVAHCAAELVYLLMETATARRYEGAGLLLTQTQLHVLDSSFARPIVSLPLSGRVQQQHDPSCFSNCFPWSHFIEQ